MNLKLVICYDGSRFSGWQRQEGLVTVQGELERALSIIITSECKKAGIANGIETPLIQCSGRTDAGVSAKGQVANLQWPDALSVEPSRLRSMLNGIVGPICGGSTFVREVTVASDNFNARHTPHLKCYSYRLLLLDRGAYFASSGNQPIDDLIDFSEESLSERNPSGWYRSWAVGSGLDIAAMARAARQFVGQHDFSAFRSSDCTATSTVRTLLKSELTRLSGHELMLIVWGKGFLKQMIRIMTGTLVEIGKGRRAEGSIIELLKGGAREFAGKTAPATGLTLEWVQYLDRDYHAPSPAEAATVG